jgi:hypothetical protein
MNDAGRSPTRSGPCVEPTVRTNALIDLGDVRPPRVCRKTGGDDFTGEVLVGQQYPISFLFQPGRSEGLSSRLRQPKRGRRLR